MAGRRRRTKEQIAADKQPPCGAIPPDVPKRRKLSRKSIPTTQDQRAEAIIDLMLHHRWDSRVTPFELAQQWGCSVSTICKAANTAGSRITLATGTLERRVQHCLDKLDKIRSDAVAAGQYSAAVRAVELELKTVGAFNKQQPGRVPLGREQNPRGLPPELAQLDPPASVEEVEHFAQTAGPMACQFEECRVHGTTVAPAPETVH